MDAVTVPLIALVTLILVKEAGVPVPVPGDLVVIGAGVAASRGDFEPVVALGAIVVASIAGGIVQYGLLRSVARPLVLRVLARFGSAERLDRQADAFRQRGAGSVAVARMTPGVRIVAIAASALARIPAVAFVGGLAVGNVVFISAHFALGYLVGEPVIAFVGGALGTVAVVGLVLAAMGLVGWLLLARRRGRARPASATIASWADACCPACLTLAALDRVRATT
jgi:membrane-associated protein